MLCSNRQNYLILILMFIYLYFIIFYFYFFLLFLCFIMFIFVSLKWYLMMLIILKECYICYVIEVEVVCLILYSFCLLIGDKYMRDSGDGFIILMMDVSISHLSMMIIVSFFFFFMYLIILHGLLFYQ